MPKRKPTKKKLTGKYEHFTKERLEALRAMSLKEIQDEIMDNPGEFGVIGRTIKIKEDTDSLRAGTDGEVDLDSYRFKPLKRHLAIMREHGVKIFPGSKAYGYGRVSTVNQEIKGSSTSDQKHEVEDYYRKNLWPKGVRWGGWDQDEMSAFNKTFIQRLAGKRLMSVLRPGDHLIIDKPDRLWRNVPDFVDLLQELEENRIVLHFVQFMDGPIDSSNPGQRLLLQMLVFVAEVESRIKSQRIAEARKVRQATQKYLMTPPLGSMNIVVDGEKKTVWDEGLLKLAELCYEIYIKRKIPYRDKSAKELVLATESRLREKYPDMGDSAFGIAEGDIPHRKLMRNYCAKVYLGLDEPWQFPSEDVRVECVIQCQRLHDKHKSEMHPLLTREQLIGEVPIHPDDLIPQVQRRELTKSKILGKRVNKLAHTS